MSIRYRGLWLLIIGVMLGLLALAGLTAVALAAPGKSGVSISLPIPRAAVVEAVRAVCADGVIHGSSQYVSDRVISGAKDSSSSPSFPRWAGSGEVFYKTRPGVVAPSHFAGAKDRGSVTVRYVVEPEEAGHTRVVIDAVFVEDSLHGRHLSQGFVERAEYDEIAVQLKDSVAPRTPPVSPATVPEPDEDRPVPPAAKARSTEFHRTYLVSEGDLKKTLQELGAFDDAPLPVLEGFTASGSDPLIGYNRPHYRFRVALEPSQFGQTTLRLEAVVTAQYTGSAASRPEYRTVPSNGRLESDLLDRLDRRFRPAALTSTSGAADLQPQAAKPAGNR
jgi:hypothetical protein